jgi:hypothetical protein
LCGEERAVEEFYLHPKMVSGRLNQCIPCVKKRNNKPKSVAERKINHLRSKYKMSPLDEATLKAFTGGICSCCGVKLEGKKRPNIEHCHSTKNIRGRVCTRCNQVIGILELGPHLDKCIKFIKDTAKNPFFYFEEVHWSPANQELLGALVEQKSPQGDMFNNES